MRMLNRWLGALAIVAFLLSPLSPAACVKAPPNLTPAASVAFHSSRVQKALDLIRDTVDDGTKTVPPVFTAALDVKVATWHESAITIIHARGAGWKAATLAGLSELQHNMSPAEQKQLGMYITMAKTLINEVVK